MKWITKRQVRFFKPDGEYLPIPKGFVISSISKRENPKLGIWLDLYYMKKSKPQDEYIVFYYEGKYRILKINDAVAEYRTGSLWNRLRQRK